jgi:hypothetical protein
MLINLSYPLSIDLVAIRKVLAGDVDALIYALDWEESPQGSNYWAGQHIRMGQGETLDENAEKFLKHLVHIAEEQYGVAPTDASGNSTS